MDDGQRLRRARTFDAIADLYDRARPSYRDVLFDDLFAISGIQADGARVLEVGCGTGQATRSLAMRGCRVVCVELGENLARIAERNLAGFPKVSVVNAGFEDWDGGGTPFDMVFAATSWHWIDPVRRYHKAASVLKPGGVLAFTTGAHVFPEDSDPFFAQIQHSYDAIGHSWSETWSGTWPPRRPEEVADAREEVERTGLFEDVHVVRYLWADEFDADSYTALMSTASDHRLMGAEQREWLLAEMRRLIEARPQARIVKHQLTLLHVARRKGNG